MLKLRKLFPLDFLQNTKRALFLFFALSLTQIYAEKECVYQLSICSLVHNEARHLEEWIEYHRLVGVDHFYLYNNKSNDGFEKVLEPYIKQGLVTLIDWPDSLDKVDEDNLFVWALGVQIPAYENAIHWVAREETKWMVFVDPSEYLVPKEGIYLKEILHQYDRYPAIQLASDCFNASTLYLHPGKTLLIESSDLTAVPQTPVQQGISKTLFKPKLCEGFRWAPYACLFKENLEPIALREREVRINHYAYRKEEDLFVLQARAKLDLDTRLLADEELSYLLKSGYDIEDRYENIKRFVPELAKKMRRKQQ